jgi:hypothetical protein
MACLVLGPRAAILAFKADSGLPLTPDIDLAFATALEKAPPREIAPERANGKPMASRIASAANAQIATGIAGTITIAADTDLVRKVKIDGGLATKAAASHGHPIVEITSLQSALDAKGSHGFAGA